MVKSASDIVSIVRNVTGRVDASDPLFSNSILIGRINDYLELLMPQEVRLYENKTWWDFTLNQGDGDPYPVDLETLRFSTIGPPAYIDGFVLNWYQSPSLFFSKWPETQTYTEQRPQDVLYYNNELVFRGPPDQTYTVKVQAYKIEPALLGGADSSSDEQENLENSYIWRYVAYGVALDIFSDFGEMDNYEKYYPAFQRYKALVYARTNQQLMSQRTYPTF